MWPIPMKFDVSTLSIKSLYRLCGKVWHRPKFEYLLRYIFANYKSYFDKFRYAGAEYEYRVLYIKY